MNIVRLSAAGGILLRATRASFTGNDNDGLHSTELQSPLRAWSVNQQVLLYDNSLQWLTYPGLFAGGSLNVISESLLNVLPAPPPHCCALDFACGSGVIAAALV